jgi:hypothetical protein
MNSSSLAILGLLLLSAPALAGEVYRFAVSQNEEGTPPADKGQTLTVLVDGAKYRVEFPPDPESPRPYSVLISKDGNREIALSLHDHTYFEPKAAEITSALFHLLPIAGDRSVSRVTMTALAQPDEVSGIPVQRHEIKLSYDITLVIPPPANMPAGVKGSSETVRGKVSVDAVYWMSEGETPVLPKLLRPDLHTGFPEVDAKLDHALAALQGIPVKQQVTITTTGDQGTEPRSSTRTVLLENHKKRATKASLFEIPAGFKMHEPEISRPVGGPMSSSATPAKPPAG